MACDGNGYDPKCPLTNPLLDHPISKMAYDLTRALAEARGSLFPYLTQMLVTFNSTVVQYHALHRAYHVLEANSDQCVQMLIDIINQLPGGPTALADWKIGIHGSMLNAVNANPALVVPGAKA